MLKDRIVLIEKEIEKTKHSAAECYMLMVSNGKEINPESTTYQNYEVLKQHLHNLLMDRDIIKQLLEQGHV